LVEEKAWLLWNWFLEWISPSEFVLRNIDDVLAFEETPFQKVAVVKLRELGKTLIIDGKLQSSLYDEHVYHESLVHPVMASHGRPERVLVLGGGEGATLREVLRYKSVVEAVMVDIDEKVVDFARRHLVEWHQGAFDDPRAKLYFMDGRKFVEDMVGRDERFDVVVLDLVDPLEGGPALRLYTREFYDLVRRLIGDEGVMVTQATSPAFYPDVFYTINSTISSVFRISRPYTVVVRSFSGQWGFVAGSNSVDPAILTPSEIDERLKSLLGDEFSKLKFYDGLTHQGLFSLSRDIRAKLEEKYPVSTDDNPVYGTF